MRTWENRILKSRASKMKADDSGESGMFRHCLPVWVLLDFAHLCSIHNTLFTEVNFPGKLKALCPVIPLKEPGVYGFQNKGFVQVFS